MTVNDKTLQNVYIIDKNGNKRRVKRIYIGVNGKAKKIADTVSTVDRAYKQPTHLSKARYSLAATSIGDYALFGSGGVIGGNGYAEVDAYDTSLLRTTPTTLSQRRIYLAATSIGNYALFGGGSYGTWNNADRYNVVDAYDTSLVRTTPTPLSEERSKLSATSVGNYALFGGGDYYNSYYEKVMSLDVVDAYDTSLVRTTPTRLSQPRHLLSSTSIGDYALFVGGYYYYSSSYEFSAVVDAYDTSLVRTTPTPLSQARYSLAATSIGDYALFGSCGSGLSDVGDIVDAYDTSLVRTTPTPLSQARYDLAATSIGNYALFGGGDKGSYTASDIVDAYSVQNILI